MSNYNTDLVMLSPNYSSRNGNKIEVITIHHTAGKLTATTIGNIFAKASRQASCNYGIGYDGKTVLVVDEKYRSWCSSSRQNDEKAITIEVSNSTGAPDWKVSDASMESLIKLVTDVCRRNGITKLKFLNDKSKRFNTAEQNMTIHCWFASTACPGPYLQSKMKYIEERVNAELGVVSAPVQTVPETDIKTSFKVKVKINNLNIRKSPNGVITGRYTGKGIFTIVQVQGDWGKLKSGAGWIYIANKSWVEKC